MATISLCMIVRDEAQTLARCLDSVRGLVDEIIVTDTGSTDNTCAIAAQYGKVVSFAWCDDFAAARNFSFSQATQAYILWLDADDVIEEADHARFAQLKAELDGTDDVVMLPYHTAIDRDGRPVFTYFRERIVRRAAGLRWEGAVHECITPRGKVRYGEAAVTHRKEKAADSGRNLRIYQAKRARGERFSAREQFYFARELQAHAQYEQAAQAFEDFLARSDGWVENRIEACGNLAECLRALGQPAQAQQALVRAFAEDSPRGETCCALAALALEQGQISQAKFWYETALRTVCDARRGGFVRPDCYGYVPCLGLCVCCDKLGRRAEAAEWNERAAVYQPQSAAVAHNRRYFASMPVEKW